MSTRADSYWPVPLEDPELPEEPVSPVEFGVELLPLEPLELFFFFLLRSSSLVPVVPVVSSELDGDIEEPAEPVP
jgi:hypothetical protein